MYDPSERCEIGPWLDAADAESPEAAWHWLATRRDILDARPYCVYVHVPYCERICSFCALYTRATPADAAEVLDQYLAMAVRAVARHPEAGRARPPTTVHFGGGTPLHLGFDRFDRLVAALRARFGDAPECEWALETTTSSVDPDTAARLGELRFTRLHVGIQTLDDAIRRRIGRRQAGVEALSRVAALVAAGFALSVDLIIGLPGSDHAVVARDLEQLYGAGVRMFSVCALRERHGAALRTPGDDVAAMRRAYRSFKEVWEFAGERGLIPIHIGQFGLSQLDNMYFTHPSRDEDCVAIGPYAHGSAGSLYYGNRLIDGYYSALRADRSPIAHAVRYTDRVQAVRMVERELLGHHVRIATLRNLVTIGGQRFADLAAAWYEHGLLLDAPGDALTLSLDGSWFVGRMVRDLRALVRPGPSPRTHLAQPSSAEVAR